MRFKAKLNQNHVELLHNVIAPISRLHGNTTHDFSTTASNATHGGSSAGGTILYIDDDKLVISTRGGSPSGNQGNLNASTLLSSSSQHNTIAQDAEGIFCFAELITTEGVFREHVIESIEQDNAILMEVNLIQLRTALRGVLYSSGGTRKKNTSMNDLDIQNYNDDQVDVDDSNRSRGVQRNRKRSRTSQDNNSSFHSIISGPEVTLKLAKRNGGLPHLCLDTMHVGQGEIEVHHAIPVRIMRVEDLQYHVPPKMAMPDIQLQLPNDRPIRSVIERFKSISPQVYVEASMDGILSLRIESDSSSIQTSYNKLTPILEDCKQSQDSQNNEKTTFTVKMDTKKLHASLHWQHTLSMMRDVSSAIICMWENEMLVLDVTLNPELGRFMYYVPVHYMSDDI